MKVSATMLLYHRRTIARLRKAKNKLACSRNYYKRLAVTRLATIQLQSNTLKALHDHQPSK